MKSVVYAKVRLVIEHPPEMDPATVVQEADYSFTASPNVPGEIVEHSIVDMDSAPYAE